MKQNTWKKNDFPVILIIGIVTIFYIGLTFLVNSDVTKPTAVAYYNNLLDAFFHKRLNIISPETLDLSYYGNKWYLYWGPAAGLFVLPFYLIFKMQANDILYTLLAGILNMYLFYFLLKQVRVFFKINTDSLLYKIIPVLAFALMSPNFYLSLKGGIWATNQVIGTAFLLLFLNSFFAFLINPKKTIYFISAIIFFHLAWLTRYTLIFYGLLFVFLFYYFCRSLLSKKIRLQVLAASIIISAIFISSFLVYNYARFGNPVETGMVYQKGVWRYDGYFKAKKVFSKTFIPHNAFYYLIRPIEIYNKRPYLKFDTEGNSIFLIYPFIIYTLFLLKNKLWRNKKTAFFSVLSIAIMGLGFSVLLVNVGTGWVQFGARYLLDILPLIYLLLVFTMRYIPKWITLILFFYGLVINIMGTLMYHSLIKW